MNGADGTARIKAEIQFFMEKGFQASFGYLLILGTVFAASETSSASTLAHSIGVRTRVVLAGAILVLNLFYFTTTLACTFAVVKRGLFILVGPSTPLDKQWEVFARSSPTREVLDLPSAEGPNLSGAMMPYLQWNIDNYYMVPIFGVLIGLSAAAAIVGITASTHRGWAELVLVVLVLGYMVPVRIIWSLHRLSKMIKEKREHLGLRVEGGSAPAHDGGDAPEAPSTTSTAEQAAIDPSA